MLKMICRLTAMALVIITLDCNAETLASYAQACASELGFDPSQIPILNCNNGIRFATGGPLNDYVGHESFYGINRDSIDLVFACRWMDKNTPSTTAVSVEMLIHNKTSGNTCFFAAKDSSNNRVISASGAIVSTEIVSPYDANAASYWMQPIDLNNRTFVVQNVSPNPRLQCVGCHVAGPYIASPRIAPFLAQFGLLNDGHDTLANPSMRRYHAVGSNRSFSAFWGWDTIVANNNVPSVVINNNPSSSICANGCHSIGLKSTASGISDDQRGFSVIPSLQEDISDIADAHVMPANASPTSDYRWVNMSTPFLLGDGGEYEMLGDLQQLYPNFFCSNPSRIEAHVVGSDRVFSNVQGSDTFHYFNLQDGLVCLNADQPNGKQCEDYQTRYLCDGTWTDWSSRDRPTASGDWEPRRGFPGLCESPTAIQAGYNLNIDIGIFQLSIPITLNGPNDRLAEFDSNGLACNNWEQDSGRCSDYVARFICE